MSAIIIEREKHKLTLKQERFIEEYVRCGNATRSAKQAGYSERTAHDTGCENLKKKYIAAEIKKRIAEKEEKLKKQGSINIERGVLKEFLKLNDWDEETTRKSLERLMLKEISKQYIEDEEYQKIIGRREIIKSSTRYDVLKRAGFKCQCCGSKPNKNNDIVLHIDHIVPYSYGGSNGIENLQVLCSKCNISKGNRHSVNHNKGWDIETAEDNGQIIFNW